MFEFWNAGDSSVAADFTATITVFSMGLLTTYRTIIDQSNSMTSPQNGYDGREPPWSRQLPFSNVPSLFSETSQPGCQATLALRMGHAH
jgi:hypothetical protein